MFPNIILGNDYIELGYENLKITDSNKIIGCSSCF